MNRGLPSKLMPTGGNALNCEVWNAAVSGSHLEHISIYSCIICMLDSIACSTIDCTGTAIYDLSTLTWQRNLLETELQDEIDISCVSHAS